MTSMRKKRELESRWRDRSVAETRVNDFEATLVASVVVQSSNSKEQRAKRRRLHDDILLQGADAQDETQSIEYDGCFIEGQGRTKYET